MYFSVSDGYSTCQKREVEEKGERGEKRVFVLLSVWFVDVHFYSTFIVLPCYILVFSFTQTYASNGKAA